jgi:hypothetical protein
MSFFFRPLGDDAMEGDGVDSGQWCMAVVMVI